MKRILALINVIILSHSLIIAQNFRIEGSVIDSQTHIPVPSAEIRIGKIVTETNNTGWFFFNHLAGKLNISIKKDNFEERLFEVTVSSDTSLTFLYEKMVLIAEVKVMATKVKGFVRGKNLEIAKLIPGEISFLPGMGSNYDLFKKIQMLPGIQSGGEGSSGLIVRGGQYDQNLCNLNGFPVYQPYHFSGFLSAIDPFMISEMEIMKGGFPAKYGGKLSSVINFNGNNSVSDSILSTINAGIFISGAATQFSPDSLSTISLSARVGTISLFKKLIENLLIGFPFYNFYDLNLNASHKINNKNILLFTFFLNKDYFKKVNTFTYYSSDRVTKLHIRTTSRSGWQDILAGVLWINKPNSNLKIQTNLFYQDFLSESYQDIRTVEKNDDAIQINSSRVKEVGLISDLVFKKGKHNLNFGLFSNVRKITPEVGTYIYTGGVLNNDFGSFDIDNLQIESGLYIEDQYLVNEKTTIRPGLRVSLLKGSSVIHFRPEPRFYISHKLTDKFSLMGSYTVTTQSIQMISSSNAMSVSDLWVPAKGDIKPSVACQSELGVFYNNWKFLTTEVNIYYKKMKDLYIYKDGASFVKYPRWEDNITPALGKSYGAEFLVQANLKKTFILLTYAISKTTRQSPVVNDGREFNYKYDKPHNLNITLGYKPTIRLSLSCSWVFQSGNMFSFYDRLYQIDFIDKYSMVPYLDKINNVRFPYYHRLDLGLERKKSRKWGKTILKIDIYNVYSKLNPWYLQYFQESEGSLDIEKINAVTLFPILPSIGYRVEF